MLELVLEQTLRRDPHTVEIVTIYHRKAALDLELFGAMNLQFQLFRTPAFLPFLFQH